MATKKDKERDQEVKDALMDDLDKFEFYVSTYWKQIVYICIAIVIIVTIAAIVLQAQQSAKFATEAEIANATTIEELHKVIQKHADIPAANTAKLKLAMMYKDKKEYNKALGILNELASSPQANEIKWQAMLNISYINELKGDKEKAAINFAKVGSDRNLPEAFRCQANYSAGRLYAELGNPEKARSALQQADIKTENMAVAFWTNQAQNMLNRIKAEANTEKPENKTKTPPKPQAKNKTEAKVNPTQKMDVKSKEANKPAKKGDAKPKAGK